MRLCTKDAPLTLIQSLTQKELRTGWRGSMWLGLGTGCSDRQRWVKGLGKDQGERQGTSRKVSNPLGVQAHTPSFTTLGATPNQARQETSRAVL